MSYDINNAFLANKVYDVKKEDAGKTYTSPDGSEWKLIKPYTENPDGYQGALFQNTATGKYEFASRGTEFNLNDGQADWQMGIGQLPDQLQSARSSLENAMDLVKAAGGNPNDMTLVGHSLGGALTQMLAAENPQLQAVTFNAYGAGNLIPPGDYGNITNHVMYLDPVSVMVGSKMPGMTLAYSEQGFESSTVLPGWTWPVLEPSFTLPSHSIERFLDPFVSPQSGQPVTIDVYPLGSRARDAINAAMDALTTAGKSVEEAFALIDKALHEQPSREAAEAALLASLGAATPHQP
ncbi:MAG: hypothetical protein WCH44_18265, partial [Betaproteobacteria bacterium]